MSKFNSPLNNIKIASPCPADWDQMYGDDRKRFCGECKLNVYNLSGMTRDEAERLVTNAEGRLCVRYYQRADGSVITQDCPVGWAKVKQRTKVYATAVASLIVALFTGVLFVSLFSNQWTTIGELRIPFATPSPTPIRTMGMIATPPPGSNTNTHQVMGNVAIEVPSSTNKPNTKFETGKMKAIADQDRKDS